MPESQLVDKAGKYLYTLCSVEPNRRTGSPGNRQATGFFASVVEPLGYEVDTTPFPCTDFIGGETRLSLGSRDFEVHISPYSLPCEVLSPVIEVSTVEELERCRCTDRILLLRGEICAEQLMPKNFVFYNPENHQRIYALLEEKRPAAIVTATARNPEEVGALYPFPLILDGDFDIPTAYCTDFVGEAIAAHTGERFRLRMDTRRVPSTSSNVIARKNPQGNQKIVLTAHIDAYEDTPGASDNASGTVVLMLLAELLTGYGGPLAVEIVALNGEDHYSAAGQMDYLHRYESELDRTMLAINIDDVGYVEGRTAYSFIGCSDALRREAGEVFAGFEGITEGEPWYTGDHMIFVQKGIPALAFTAERMPELMKMVTHTQRDRPELIDCAKLVELARALDVLIRRWTS
ncbi:MAG: M28 family peptidase [Spirochaetaceae bacterium]|nr:MAG: M28 family peptidase [Spirochaetaceae bacterium]